MLGPLECGFGLSILSSFVLALIPFPEAWYATYDESMEMMLAGDPLFLAIATVLAAPIVEEVIFRGFLFEAMREESERAAIIVSAVTFGIGHIVNLFNGRGMELVSNLCQVVGAIAIGFLFVLIFHRGGSLISCIITHSAIDVASVFNNSDMTTSEHILFSLSRLVIVVGYTLVLLKTLPRAEPAKK